MKFSRIALLLTTLLLANHLFADALDRPVLKEEWRKEVMDAVNWDYPGLEEGKKLYLAGNLKAASKFFASYLRNKPQPASLCRKAEPDMKRAKEGVNYIWRYGANSHKFPNRKIDWFYNKTADIPGMFDREWQCQLNRMPWFTAMADAYMQSKDPVYPATFARQLRDWAVSCPQPPEGKSGNYPNSAWRNIEMGLRLGSYWPRAYAAFIKAPEFKDDDILLYCALGLWQSRRLHRENTYGNIFFMEMNGLYTFGAMFPEFKESKANRIHAVKNVYDKTKTLFLPDGFIDELTNSYHRTVVALMINIFNMAQDCNLRSEIPADFTSSLERAYVAFTKLTTPGLDMPMSNDSRHADVPGFFAPAVKLFPEHKEFLWVHSKRKLGSAPKFLSVLMPWSGFVIMRESWNREASYLIFDIGPLGMRHAHQDKLNIAIWKGKDQLLYDDGGGGYARSKYRKYTVSSLAHNLISVDGTGQATNSAPKAPTRKLSAPVTGDFRSDGKTDYARGVFDQGWGRSSGNKIVTHERQVLYIRPNIFIVFDRMIPTRRGRKKPHTYQARWHVDTLKMLPALDGHPTLVSSIENTATERERINRDRKRRNRIVIAPLFTDGVTVNQATGKINGNWDELAGVYAIHPYRITTTVTHTRKPAKGEQRFLTMFVTLNHKEPSPIAAVIQHGTNGADVKLKDGRTVKITIRDGKLSADVQ